MASRTKKVFALSLGQGLTSVVMLVSGMVLARVLTKHDFGTVRQTLLAYQFAAPLLTLGLPQAIYYFLPEEKERPRGVLIDNLTLLVALSCVFSLFLALGGNELLAMRFDNPKLTETLKWMIPYPLFVMPVMLLGGVMVIRERVTALSVYNVCTRAVLGISIIAAALWTHTYTGPLFAHILVPALTLPVGLWMTFKSVPGEWCWPNLASMKEMLKFSVPLGLATMLGTITLQLDKVIVSVMTSPEEFAVYANGAVEIPLIGIVTGSVTAVILADMRKHAAKGEYLEAVKLFRLTAEKTSYILFPVMFFLLVSADSFIQTLFSVKYSDSALPFRIYLLLLPIRTVVFGSLLMAIDKTRLILIRSFISLVINCFLSVLFVSFLGPWGAVVATVITVYCWDVLYNLYTLGIFFEISWDKFFPLKIWAKSTFFLVILSVVLFFIDQQIDTYQPLLRLCVGGGFYWLFILFWWNGKIYSMDRIQKKICKSNIYK